MELTDTSLRTNALLGLVNVLLITLDSCRWDSYERAATLNIDRQCRARKAHAQGTFTYAAHMAMLQGILPHHRPKLPYYNRYQTQLIRIANRPTVVPSLFRFERGTEDIVDGFRQHGYRTFATGSVGWFAHPHLQRPFDEFNYFGINAHAQVKFSLTMIAETKAPFFGLVNFGETHDPYRYSEEPGRIDYPEMSPPRRPVMTTRTYDSEAHARQVQCCEFLDRQVGKLIESVERLKRGTIVVVCGDHGECFGEAGLLGHGFYHPKVMEVPLAIFGVNLPRTTE